jgi:xanthine dehydrogenase YagT iron-sulfur-binding subunit
MALSQLPVGSPAPAFVIRGDHGVAIGVRPGGRPRVLAFVRVWRPAHEHAGQIRALLRGLGAEMTILSDSGVWSFRPDDPIEVLPCAAARLAANVHTTELLYGVGEDRDAVFVIDEHGTVAFSHAPREPLTDMLAGALGAAVDAMHAKQTPPITFTRREWATSCLVTGFAVALFGCKSDKPRSKPVPDADDRGAPAPPPAPADLDIILDVNGTKHALRVDPRTSLLDALRERLGLVGTKKGCDGGQCGACTVHVGGKRVVACLTLAASVHAQPVKTIEGLAGAGGELHPMQAAFVAHDAFQCGFCTPGQIMSAVAMLDEHGAATHAGAGAGAITDDHIREHMSGNLCRCGAYPNIVAAIRAARGA